MKKKLIAGMTSTALIASIGAPAFAANFSDVNGHWAASTINKLADAGIINGTDATHFDPQGTLTRAQFAKLITVALKLDTSSTTSSFSDVSGWAVGYVEAAKKAGIINGTDATHFDPNGTLNREQAAAIMVRALKTQVTLEDGSDINFPDASAVSSWFKTDVATAIKYGLLNGKDGNLAPQGNATRAEAAVLTDRFLTTSDQLKNAKFAVQSVASINAKQLQVVFTNGVDSANLGTYSLAGVGTSLTPVLQADGKTVVLTIPNGSVPANGTDAVLTVTNAQKSGDATKVVSSYAQSIHFNDTTAPSLASVTSATSGVAAGTVTVNFSEPVNYAVYNTKLVVDGTNAASVAWSNNDTTATITNVVLDPSKSHTLAAVNAGDYATPGNVAGFVSQSFNVTTDQVAPTVNLSVRDDHDLTLTFSKKMDPNTVTTASGTNYTVIDEAGTPVAGTVTPDSTDTTGTKFVLALPTTIYASKSSHTYSVAFPSRIADTLGNTLVPVTQQISLSQDTSAPAITSLGYDTDSASGNVKDIVLNVSKGVYAGAVDATKIKVVDPNGNDVTGLGTTPFFAASSTPALAGDKKIVLQFPAGATKALSGTYTFYLPAGLVTDNSTAKNPTAAVVLTQNFGTATNTFKIAQTAVTSATSVAGDGTESFSVNFGTAVKGGAIAGSATDPSNYTVNGSVLPAGTYITLTGSQTTANIVLPKGTIAADNAYAGFTVNNVQSTTGNTVAPFSGYVGVLDNTAPVLQSAKIVDSTHVILTFSEAMANTISGSSVANTELTVTNGSTYGGSVSATRVVGSNNQVALTFGTALDLTKTVTFKTGTATVLKDASTHNATVSGTTVTATN